MFCACEMWGVGQLTSMFLGWCFSGATQFCCIATSVFLMSRNMVQTQRSLVEPNMALCIAHVFVSRLPQEEGRQWFPRALVICSFSCVLLAVYATVETDYSSGCDSVCDCWFLKGLLQTELPADSSGLQHLPCMSDSFCGLFECGLGRFSRCVKT